MNTRAGAIGVSLIVMVGLMSCGLGREAEGAWISEHYSGTYYVALGHEPLYSMEIDHSGSSVEFAVTGSDVDVEGTGTVSGRTMTLSADLGFAVFSAELTFDEDGESFSGTWELDFEGPVAGSITGSRTPWQEYDVDAHGIPRFAWSDYIPLAKVWRISKFRSGEGHDYSDDFESCRSMKHYYLPDEGVAGSSVSLFSPVTGTVLGTTDEWDEEETFTGTAVGIRPEGHEAFFLVIYHVDLRQPLEPGDVVVVGQELGTALDSGGALTDIGVGVHTPYGHRYVSYFEVMSDQIFARYESRGASSRGDFIITREARDADPLICEDSDFADVGNLENWFTLGDAPPRMRSPRSRRR
jgi:hypothetical protein